MLETPTNEPHRSHLSTIPSRWRLIGRGVAGGFRDFSSESAAREIERQLNAKHGAGTHRALDMNSPAGSSGWIDGWVAASVAPDRSWTDAFIKRTELPESDRSDYRTAFEAAYADSRRFLRR